jgi:lipopolysaccharide assembly outer membrane protein LptD (OstA)
MAILYYQYSLNEIPRPTETLTDIVHSNSDDNSSNIINNIEYKSFDADGNQYQIRAKLGKISDENPNLILMENVESQIIFKNNKKIFINALLATYNVINYDTIFKDNIDIKYDEHYVNCNNVDLFFKDNNIKLYNNIRYNNLDTFILADEIQIDLLTQNLKIYMIDKDKKVKAVYKNNVSN